MKIRQWPRYGAAFFVCMIAEIVLTGNIAGLFHQLDSRLTWLGIQVILLVLGWAIWCFCHRPSLALPSFSVLYRHSLSGFQKFWLVFLGFWVVLCFGVIVVLILLVPPNNNDSMVVHLVRVGYWLQHNSFSPWNALIERQVIYPYNAQIVVLWTILMHGRDTFAAFLQFFSVLFTSLGIYAIIRQLKGTRYQAALVALFYLTFPQVVLQASTTQDDLVITCLLILGVVFLFHWLDSSYQEWIDLCLTGLSWALALGIKPTAFYFFPGVLLVLLIYWVTRKMNILQIGQLALAGLLAFGIFSSYAYWNNWVTYRNPLGPSEFVKMESGAFSGNLWSKLRINGGRFLYQFVSLDGLPPGLTQPLQTVREQIANRFPALFDDSTAFLKDIQKPFSLANAPGINEDYSWFGPVSILLLFPAFFLGLVYLFKKRDGKILFLLLVSLLLFVSVAVLRPGWDPYQGRYVNPAIALLMPLSFWIFDRRVFSQVYTALLVILAVFVLLCSTFLNESKPLLTQAAVKRFAEQPQIAQDHSLKGIMIGFSLNLINPYLPARQDILSLDEVDRETFSSVSQGDFLREYFSIIPAGARVGIYLQNGDWEYPLFGRNFEYQLVPLTSSELLLDDSYLNQENINFLVVHQIGLTQLPVTSLYTIFNQISDEQNQSGFWQFYKEGSEE
jgi:4-amino-4-deoxy-L-arabinose transferase-like glycosyltransferase